MAHETETLAAYVAELKFGDIPPEVLERAKVLTLDFLGSAIRARRDAESTPSLLKMLEALALDGKGESTVFGDDKTWTPAVAALLNGALLPARERAGRTGRVRGRRDDGQLRSRRPDRDRGGL
jgi:2-methylcitrate dehydratase PrpD